MVVTLTENYTKRSDLLSGITDDHLLAATGWAREKIAGSWLIPIFHRDDIKQLLGDNGVNYATVVSPVKKAAPVHPSWYVMISKSIKDMKDRRGSSRYAIKKYILANWNVNKNTFNYVFRNAINKLVTNGQIIDVSEGKMVRFKIGAKDEVVTKTKAVKSAKSAPKTSRPIAVGTRPSYIAMITKAIEDEKDTNGSTRQAIKKYIHAMFAVNKTSFASAFKSAIKRAVESGDIIDVSGGKNIRFKLGA